MSSVRYTTNNQNTYGAEQGYTVPNPIQTVTNAAEAQYAGYYQSALPAGYTNSNVANKEVVYANYVAPNTTTSEVRNTYAFGTGNTGATYALPATGATNYINNATTYASNYANNAATYANNTATNVASTVRNTVVSDAIAPPPKITFGHPSGGYATTTTSYYQQPPAVNTTTVVTQQQPAVQTVQTITSNVAVQERPVGQGSIVHQVKTNAPTGAVSTQGSSYVPKADDSFLCNKWCWILSAILGVALLTLALLYGLGVIGGPVGKGTETSAPVANAGSGKVGAGNLNVNGPHIATPGVNVNGGSVSGPNVNLNGARVPPVNVNGPSVSTGTTSVSPIPSVGVNTQPSVNYQQPTVRPATVAPVSVAPTPVAYNNGAVYNGYAAQPTAVNTEPVYQPTYVQPSAVSVKPVVAEPSAVSYQPTYVRPAAVSVQPVSVESSAVSYQPTYTRPTVQPAAVSVQPVSVQPTAYNGAYNGPIRPTVSYPQPTEVYNAPRNSQFVPAVPVQ